MSAGVGALFLVSTKAITHDDVTVRAQYIIVANKADDISARLRWGLDTSKYKSIYVTETKKIRNKLHRLWMRVENVNDERPTHVTDTDREGAQAVHYHKTNQPDNRDTFAIGIGGKVQARSLEHAYQKVAQWLLLEADPNADPKPPFQHGYQFIAEEVGESDSTAVVDYERVDGHAVPGGAIGMARR